MGSAPTSHATHGPAHLLQAGSWVQLTGETWWSSLTFALLGRFPAKAAAAKSQSALLPSLEPWNSLTLPASAHWREFVCTWEVKAVPSGSAYVRAWRKMPPQETPPAMAAHTSTRAVNVKNKTLETAPRTTQHLRTTLQAAKFISS